MILPHRADNYEHAAMCEKSGAAVSLRPDDANAGNLLADVRRVLQTQEYAAASRRFAREIAARPDAAEVAQALRAWVATF